MSFVFNMLVFCIPVPYMYHNCLTLDNTNLSKPTTGVGVNEVVVIPLTPCQETLLHLKTTRKALRFQTISDIFIHYNRKILISLRNILAVED